MKIYVVLVSYIRGGSEISKVNQIGYRSYEEAKAFIEYCAKNSKMLGARTWLADTNTLYEIIEVTV